MVVRSTLALGACSLLLLTAACGGGEDAEPCSGGECQAQLSELLDDVEWETREVTDLELATGDEAVSLADTLPPIDEYPLSVTAPSGGDRTVVEIFASTEKSGEDENGWMVEVAEEFNNAEVKLADGSTAAVQIRQIDSGTAYQFIAAGRDRPDGFSPANQLWIEMASEWVDVDEVRASLVPNVAGIVMREEIADGLGEPSTLDPSAVISAVIDGDLVMGYTNPMASSTGLNFMLTVLDDFAEGDEGRLTDPDVASVFESFQAQVPYVALTTLQLQEAVQNDDGTLDAFVMEWQTFQSTPELSSGYSFIPFGVPHDSPLYAIGELPAERREALELFADFASQPEYQSLAAENYSFDPPELEVSIEIPAGGTLIDLQEIWKENKDGGDPVAVVFVVDVSSSMLPSRIEPLRESMLSSANFINEETAIGVVEFNDTATVRLPLAEFDSSQEGRFRATANQLSPNGGTAMYDGVVVGLNMIRDAQEAEPNTRGVLIVLTDGKTVSGLSFNDVAPTVQGLGVPVITVGFEAQIDELARLSSLVEAASVNADVDDVEFTMAELFNALG